MKDCYIPDLTERYPEGLDGVDMFKPYDPEAEMWDAMERDYREQEQRTIERISRTGYTIIKQDADGWTFAENDEDLILCTIKDNTIVYLYDVAKNIPENRDFLIGLWEEMRTGN